MLISERNFVYKVHLYFTWWCIQGDVFSERVLACRQSNSFLEVALDSSPLSPDATAVQAMLL